MTLLWVDGFEGQDAATYYTGGGNGTYDGTSTRFNYGAKYRSSGGAFTLTRSITSSAEVYVGFAVFQASTVPVFLLDILSDSGASFQISIVVNANYSIEIRRGSGTTIAVSAANVLPYNSWAFIEVHAKISDTVGIVEVRVNGDPTAVVSYSGDTKAGGTDNIDTLRWTLTGSGQTQLDDIYICNALGSVNNSWLGDVRVQTLIPNGAGSSTGLTPSAGTNWSNVDEAPASATDYNGSATPGARDTYALVDLSAGAANVKGVRLDVSMHKSDAGAASMKAAIKVGSTVAYDPTVVLGTSMASTSNIREVSPDTSAAWTVSEVNGAEIGAEVV